ncbi:MAG: nicotinate-nucleotide adenylyltransferase [Candidatus Omnitrophota bacterium]|nr:nicotinate-nucleotide adenylyltransferase [Candidatus Omnitrophota bacterium]
MKIGILGGTFNPVHIGHLILVQEVQQKLGLDKIFFIPTNIPPHKESYNVSASHRFNMVKLAIKGDERFEALDLEIKRGGISYTIDTVRKLKVKYLRSKFYLIVGSDLANDFPTWRYFAGLRKAVKIVVAKRRAYPLKIKDKFIKLDIVQMGISSSHIRGLIKKGLSINYFVPGNVLKYIQKYKLYKK